MPTDLVSNIATFAGVRVIVSPLCTVPKIALSTECPVGDNFRTSFNAWLLERFGTKEVAFVHPQRDVMFVGPNTYETLKKSSTERNGGIQ